MSSLGALEGRGRPWVVAREVEVERREERVEEKARDVEEESSLGWDLGLRLPYREVSEDIVSRRCGCWKERYSFEARLQRCI